MPQLPVELYSLITANIRPDQDSNTLKSSALSFRQLTVPSHQQLFSHVIIRTSEQCCPRFHRFGGSSASFKNLLDKSPHIADMIRCLEIFDFPDWHNLWTCPVHSTFTVKNSWLSQDENLYLCLPRFKRMEALNLTSLFGRAIEDLWSVAPRALVSALQNIIQLPSLIYIDMEGATLLPTLQTLGSSIKYLTLHNQRGGEHNIRTSAPENKLPIVLESLNIAPDCDTTDMDPLLLGIGTGSVGRGVSLSQLKRLYVSLEIQYELALPFLVKVLHECRNSIEEFVFVPFTDGRHTIMIHISRFPKLT
jgi:hypothetical protein